MHPIAFDLGSWPVRWYGVMMALAFLAGFWTAGRRAPRDGIPGDKIADLIPWLMIGAIVGARAVYAATYWDTLMKDPLFPRAPWTEAFMVQRGGLVYYGGLIGAALTGIVYSRIRALPLWKVADILAPSIALGSVFGRIGCLLNGCCYGRACSLPWAIHFPPDHETHGLPVHPTEIYDAALNLGLYVALAWLYRHKRFDGQVFATYLLCYAATRSFVEMFRGDYASEHIHGGLTPAQLVGIGIFAAGLVLFAVLQRRATKRG